MKKTFLLKKFAREEIMKEEFEEKKSFSNKISCSDNE
jgi:hypothetical protein